VLSGAPDEARCYRQRSKTLGTNIRRSRHRLVDSTSSGSIDPLISSNAHRRATRSTGGATYEGRDRYRLASSRHQRTASSCSYHRRGDLLVLVRREAKRLDLVARRIHAVEHRHATAGRTPRSICQGLREVVRIGEDGSDLGADEQDVATLRAAREHQSMLSTAWTRRPKLPGRRADLHPHSFARCCWPRNWCRDRAARRAGTRSIGRCPPRARMTITEGRASSTR
jgi:hypothetical protein